MRFAFLALFISLFTSQASAFCGFYVARADGELYNEASKVVFVRDGQNSVITMSSDYRGPVQDFVMVVPTPKVLRRNQINTVQPTTVNQLDAYSAPRLVEYRDGDPCAPVDYGIMLSPVEDAPTENVRQRGANALGVTIEAEYQVGIYDIVML
ncbi:DUF2330 domain-containing protein [Parasulfitobacter algicola]|uniref:DUF2330 domain-containing protein n=1 Tax=Parasulfitobacter algicola TaxID=2614809 RepID=A0ABX2IVL7_9RHOB|nr:DUF2330 domain-containing protein [Sulfitobacter algicola]NSX54321.1 DUF2330 domain-containing protein [Sulfitobacter algicola]